MKKLKISKKIVALLLTAVLLASLPLPSNSAEESRTEEIEQLKGWLAKEHFDVHPGMVINQRARLARLELVDDNFPEARLDFQKALIGFGKLPAKGPEVQSVSYTLFVLAEYFEKSSHGADCREDINKLAELYGQKYCPIELSAYSGESGPQFRPKRPVR